MEFQQSCAGFCAWLGIPALVALVILIRTGLWGLWVFPESHPALRLVCGYGPFFWAFGVVAALVRTLVLNTGVSYEINATRLVRRQGRQVLTMKLDKAYVTRSPDKIFPRLRVSDGRREFAIQAIFMPRFEEFANLLEVGSRMRRSEEKL